MSLGCSSTTTPRYRHYVSPAGTNLPDLDPLYESHFVAHVEDSSHILLVRIIETGSLQETMPDGEMRAYTYARVEIERTIYAVAEAIEPYRERFSIFHMTHFETPTGEHGDGIRSPISNLRGRADQSVIFVGDLPSSQSGSFGGWIPVPFREEGYDSYFVETRELLDPQRLQSVMTIIGPQ